MVVGNIQTSNVLPRSMQISHPYHHLPWELKKEANLVPTLLRLPRWALNPKHGGTVVWLCLRSGSCESSGVKKHLHEIGQEKKQSKKKGGRWRRWRRRGGWGGNHGESFQCKLVDVLWRTTTLQVRIRSSRILVRAWPRYSPSFALILGLAILQLWRRGRESFP